MNRSLAAADKAARKGSGRVAVWVLDDGTWHRWVNYGQPDADPAMACGKVLEHATRARAEGALPARAERHEACR